MAIKQRFTYFFAGDDIDTDVWQFVDLSGTGSGAMVDVVDGGYGITSGATATNQSGITFNDKRQYDFDNSVVLFTIQRVATDSIQRSGLTSVGGETASVASIYNDSGFSNYQLRTATDASGSGNTDTGDPVDTAFHNWKLILQPTSVEAFLDGVTTATRTTNPPDSKLQPFMTSSTKVASAKECRIRNMEAFNT